MVPWVDVHWHNTVVIAVDVAATRLLSIGGRYQHFTGPTKTSRSPKATNLVVFALTLATDDAHDMMTL